MFLKYGQAHSGSGFPALRDSDHRTCMFLKYGQVHSGSSFWGDIREAANLYVPEVRPGALRGRDPKVDIPEKLNAFS